MTNTMLQSLQVLCATSEAFSLEVHSAFTKAATFVVPDDDAYFVLESEGRFWSIIGEFRLDDQGEPKAFGVNIVQGFDHQLAAMACAMNYAINDSGAADCVHAHVREAAPYISIWQ